LLPGLGDLRLEVRAGRQVVQKGRLGQQVSRHDRLHPSGTPYPGAASVDIMPRSAGAEEAEDADPTPGRFGWGCCSSGSPAGTCCPVGPTVYLVGSVRCAPGQSAGAPGQDFASAATAAA